MGEAHGGSAGMIAADEAAALLYREALSLDRGEWDDWLALFTEDAVFWMPAWRDDVALALRRIGPFQGGR